MSLINDALKRASKSDRSRPPQAEPPCATLKPAVAQSNFPLGLVLAAGVILALASAGWLYWQNLHTSHPPVPKNETNFADSPTDAEPPSGATDTTSPTSATEQVSAPPPQPKKAKVSWPMELKLNAIIFSKSNPMAMINGKTVAVGDFIEQIHVSKIERDRVILEWNGQVKELVMK